MTVLARSDHAGGVFCGSKDLGCCGEPHLYEIGRSGYPEITCSRGCEDFLRSDPNHAGQASRVPETYDEKTEREDWEKRGAKDVEYLQAITTARATGTPIPESLLRVARGGRTGPALRCQNGHVMAEDANFCDECGTSPASVDVVRCKDDHANKPTAKFCKVCAAPMGQLIAGTVIPDSLAVTRDRAPKPWNKDMKADELRAACAVRGLDATGTRAALIGRLRAAK